MQILITGGPSRLTQAVYDALAGQHQFQYLGGDIRDPETCRAALDGVDAVLHFDPLQVAAAESLDAVTRLDRATRGTYVLLNAARAAAVGRVILWSSLDLFERLPANWRVDEQWRPRPGPQLAQLCPWLAELSARELTRLGRLQTICLRFGRIVSGAEIDGQPFDPRWLHLDDAVQAVERALKLPADRLHTPDWTVFHITAAGAQAKIRCSPLAADPEGLNYQPQHDFQDHPAAQVDAPDRRPWREVLAPSPMSARPIHNVVIFGAGGPMGAIAAAEMAPAYRLRLTDLRPLADIAAEDKPQSPGAPLPVPLAAPHENRVVDVRDPAQVLAACEGMDAIINCTVVRPDPVDAFLVNTIGAYNIMRAAVVHRIKRVVQTGPTLQLPAAPSGYSWDYDLPPNAPPRPADHLYFHSKYLGQEICRVFAEAYDLTVPVLLFFSLRNPVMAGVSHPFVISWPDTGRALRRAVEVPDLPSPYEEVNIAADLPHGRYDFSRMRTILGWQPRDDLAHHWREGE